MGPYVCTANKGSLYEQFHVNVPGSGQLGEAAHIFDQLAGEYDQHQRDLVAALSTIRATYSGTAAAQMQGAFRPLIDALGQGQTIAQQSASTLNTQAGHFGAAQAAIKDHVNVPDPPWYEPIDPFNTAHDDAVEQNSDIDTANQAAYRQYADATSKNSGAAPTFPSGAFGTGDISVTGGSQVHPAGGPGASGPPVGGGGTASDSRYSGHHGGSQPGGTTYSGGDWNGGGSPVVAPPPGSGGGSTGAQGYTPSGPVAGGPTTGPGYPFGGAPVGPGADPLGDGLGPGAPIGVGGGFGPGGLGGDETDGRVGGGRGYGPRGSGAYSGGGSGGDGARGRGAMSGAGPAEEAFPARQGGAVAGRPGAPGAAGGGGMGGAGKRKEEDRERRSAAYLVDESHANEIVGDLPRTVPPVIG